MKINIITSLILVFFLSGCSSIQYQPASTFTPVATNTVHMAVIPEVFPTSTPTILAESTMLEITATSKDNQLILKGFQGYIFWLAWSNDGKQLLIGTEKSGLVIYDIVNKKVAANFEKDLRSGLVIQDLALSPDQKTLAMIIYNERSIRLVNPQTGNLIKTLYTPDYWPHQLQFSPDSKTLASRREDKYHEIIFWEVATGKEINRLSNDTSFGRFSFSPSENLLMAATGNNSFTVWDTNTWKLQRTVQCECSSWFYFSPDGNKFAASDLGTDKTISIWDFQNGKKLFDLSSIQHNGYTMAYDPSGKYIAIGDGYGGSNGIINTITIWDANKGTQVHEMATGLDATTFVLAYSPDGTRLASGGANLENGFDGQVIIWDIPQP